MRWCTWWVGRVELGEETCCSRFLGCSRIGEQGKLKSGRKRHLHVNIAVATCCNVHSKGWGDSKLLGKWPDLVPSSPSLRFCQDLSTLLHSVSLCCPPVSALFVHVRPIVLLVHLALASPLHYRLTLLRFIPLHHHLPRRNPPHCQCHILTTIFNNLSKRTRNFFFVPIYTS